MWYNVAMNNENAVRILYVIPGLNVCGGMESYAMNYLRHIDRSKYIIDFATHDVGEENYVYEIESLGGKVYVLPRFSLKNIKPIKAQIKNILSENKYDIIHCHMANAGMFYFNEARKQGIKVRILHSHQSKAADKFSHAVRNYPLLWLAKIYATHFVACSKLAGDFLFGNEHYTLLNNAIEPEKFAPDIEARKRIRDELGITDDTLLLGHVGRLCPQKNQAFLLEVFKHILDFHPDSKLVLIGEGEDEGLLKQKAMELGIIDEVIFHGVERNVAAYYQAMDVFCMPSLYEGLSVVAVEAQGSGLPCIFSDDISKETDLGGVVEFMSLKESPVEWAKKVVALGHTDRVGDPSELLDKSGYNINLEAENLVKYYDKLLEIAKN